MAVTSIDVDESYHDALVRWKNGQSSWTLLAYLPGSDAPHAEFICGDITLPGGGVARIAVTTPPSSPTVTLTTAWRLTFPVEANGTDEMARYLHNTDGTQWA